MKANISRSKRDITFGFENLYNMEIAENGEWEIIKTWAREHNCTHIICDFRLLKKGSEYMLFGASANMAHWIGEGIALDRLEKMSMDDMAYCLDA